jgi:hypothetical protein
MKMGRYTPAIMRGEFGGRIGDASVAGVCASVSAMQHGIAGNCVQPVSVIFSDHAFGRGLCGELAGEQDGHARGDPEFYGSSAAGEPCDGGGLFVATRAGCVEDIFGWSGRGVVGRFTGDEAIDEWDSSDLRRT